MTVRGGSGGTDAVGGLSAAAKLNLAGQATFAGAGNLSALGNLKLIALATFPGVASFREAQIFISWGQTPPDTAHFAESPNQTPASAQTAVTASFSATQAGHGSGTIAGSDTVNAAKVAAVAKASSTSSNINLGALRYRAASTDTDYNVTLTTSDAYYESSIFTDTLANLNASEAGWNKRASTAAGTQRVEDVWVMVSYSPATPNNAIFAGSGLLSASTRANLAALAQFGGQGSLSAAATAKLIAAASFQGSGSLSALGLLGAAGLAVFSGSGSLSADLQKFSFTNPATFSGSGSLAAIGTLIAPIAATFAGSGNLSALSAVQAIAAATFAGSGSLSANGILAARAAATFAGSGSLAADTQHLKAAQAAFSGAGSLAADLLTYIYLTAERFDGAGSLIANATLVSGASNQVNAEFDGTGNLSALAALAAAALAEFDGAGGLSAGANLRQAATAAFAGAGNLSATAVLVEPAMAAFAGVGSLTASAQALAALNAAFSGTGTLAATVNLGLAAQVLFTGGGSLSAAGILALRGLATFQGAGSLAATANLALTARATFAGAGSLTVDLLRVLPANFATFAGSGLLSASANLRSAALATFSGAGNLSASTLAKLSAFAHLDGAGVLAAVANLRMLASARLGGQGSFSADLTLLSRAFTGETFPPFIQADFLVQGYSNKRDSATVRSAMESGFDRVRLVNRNPLRILNCAIFFTAYQAEFFTAWYDYSAKNGEVWFRIDIPIESVARTVLARFVGQPTLVPLANVADRWQLTAQLEINDPNLISRSAFTPPDDGIFPSEVLEDAILVDNFSSKRAVSGNRSDASNEGIAKFRTSTLTPFRIVTVSWQWDDNQLAYFNEWLEYRARHEAGFFTIDIPIDNQAYRTVRARFSSPPVINAVSFNRWEAVAELEARDLNEITPADLAELVALFAEATFDDLINMISLVEDLTLDPFFDAWNVPPLNE